MEYNEKICPADLVNDMRDFLFENSEYEEWQIEAMTDSELKIECKSLGYIKTTEDEK